MAAGDLNDPLSNIPNIVLVDQSAATAAPGAGYGRLEVVNGVLGLRVGTGAWVALVSLVAGLLTSLTEKGTPADTDLVLLQDEADSSALKKAQVGNLPGGSTPGAFAGASVYHDAAQSLSDQTGTYLAMNSERFDTDSYHDNSTNNSRITIPTGKAGKYLLTVNVDFAQNNNNRRWVAIRKNRTTTLALVGSPALTNGDAAIQVTCVAALAEADYVEVYAWQNSGGPLDISAVPDWSPVLTAVLLG